MSLEEKKTGRKSSGRGAGFKISYFDALEDGLYYRRGTLQMRKWPYPIFIGKIPVASLGPEPVKVEFVKEGKKYKLVFYDDKLGMIAKISIPKLHTAYIIHELLSKHGGIPFGGKISEEKTGTILQMDKNKLADIVKDAEKVERMEIYK